MLYYNNNTVLSLKYSIIAPPQLFKLCYNFIKRSEINLASINDVAKLAKVSKSTVSLVINNNGYVSDETREKVQKAIKELNYIPSRLAQGLSKNHSGLIAVVVPDAAHPYFSTLIKSIEQELASKEYMTIVCSAKQNEKNEQWYIEMLNRKIVDGIITAGHTIDQNAYKNSSRPIVSIDRYINDNIPIVRADHEKAAKLAADKLLSLGCKNIFHFSGTPNIDVQSDIFNDILHQTLTQAKVNVNSVYIGHNTFHISEYKKASDELFNRFSNIDAVVGVDAAIAFCLKKAYEKKISVPEKLKLLAYDGTYITKLHTPVIYAICQPIEQIGECAAQLIVKIINEEKLEKMQYILPVHFENGQTL